MAFETIVTKFLFSYIRILHGSSGKSNIGQINFLRKNQPQHQQCILVLPLSTQGRWGKLSSHDLTSRLQGSLLLYNLRNQNIAVDANKAGSILVSLSLSPLKMLKVYFDCLPEEHIDGRYDNSPSTL